MLKDKDRKVHYINVLNQKLTSRKKEQCTIGENLVKIAAVKMTEIVKLERSHKTIHVKGKCFAI